MTEYADKMKALRQKTTQALDKPKPAYRVMSVDPKGGNIDDQFALIESAQAYGSPASDPSMRKILVGDSLPEGEVTAITPEGIKVIPDYGDEYVIPLGGRPGYKPPTKTVQAKPPLFDPDAALFAFDHLRDLALAQGIGESFSREDGEPTSFEDLKAEKIAEINHFKNMEPAKLVNTEIYGDYIPGAEDMSPDELREASFDAAAKNYGQKYEDRQPHAEEDVEIDGIPYTRETYESGEVFLVPTGEEGDIMRDYDDEERKEKFESDVAKVNAAFGG